MASCFIVTGCAGFIGSRVAEMLLDRGDTVVGVDNLNDAYDPRLKVWRLRKLRERTGFRFAEADIADTRSLEAHLLPALPARIDGVVNLAARAGVRPSVRTPQVYIDTNVTGTLNLLDLCLARGIGKFVLASTSSLYGGSNKIPFHEDDDTSRPLSPYAATKKAAEALCYTYRHLHGLDMTVFRYFTVYGPAGRPDMSIFRFVRQIAEGERMTVFGDGTQARDFTFIDDIARGTILGLKPLGFEVINLGGDRPVVLNDIIGLIEKMLGKKAGMAHAPAHPADVPATWASVEKARALLGWAPEVSVEEGLRRSVQWYLDERPFASTLRLGD